MIHCYYLPSYLTFSCFSSPCLPSSLTHYFTFLSLPLPNFHSVPLPNSCTSFPSISPYLTLSYCPFPSFSSGIEAATEDLKRENEERLWQEGILRHVPIVGSVYNWFSPPPPPGIKGRTLDLTAGVLESTENIYRYHMQVSLSWGLGEVSKIRWQKDLGSNDKKMDNCERKLWVSLNVQLVYVL